MQVTWESIGAAIVAIGGGFLGIRKALDVTKPEVAPTPKAPNCATNCPVEDDLEKLVKQFENLTSQVSTGFQSLQAQITEIQGSTRVSASQRATDHENIEKLFAEVSSMGKALSKIEGWIEGMAIKGTHKG